MTAKEGKQYCMNVNVWMYITLLQMTAEEGKQYCQRKVDKLQESLSNVQGVSVRGMSVGGEF